MLNKKDILKLESRRNIYNYIDENPGLNIRQISRDLNIPFTTLNYHIKYLKKMDLIKENKEGKYKKIFISNKLGMREKQILGLLRNDNSCKILIHTIWTYSCSQIELSKELLIPPSTVSYYLKRMIDMDIIEEVKSVDGRIYPIPGGKKYIERKPIRSEKFYKRKNTKDSFIIYKLLIAHKFNSNTQKIIDYYIDSYKYHEKNKDFFKGKKILRMDSQINNFANLLDIYFRPPFCS